MTNRDRPAGIGTDEFNLRAFAGTYIKPKTALAFVDDLVDLRLKIVIGEKKVYKARCNYLNLLDEIDSRQSRGD